MASRDPSATPDTRRNSGSATNSPGKDGLERVELSDLEASPPQLPVEQDLMQLARLGELRGIQRGSLRSGNLGRRRHDRHLLRSQLIASDLATTPTANDGIEPLTWYGIPASSSASSGSCRLEVEKGLLSSRLYGGGGVSGRSSMPATAASCQSWFPFMTGG